MAKTKVDQQQTRSALLDAAEKLFSEASFNRVSLREITTAAGANVAAVNYHFGSKEGLILEVIRRIVEPISDHRMEAVTALEEQYAPEPIPPRELIEAYIRPVVMLLDMTDQRASRLQKLASRCISDPQVGSREEFGELFRREAQRFGKNMMRSLPELEIDEIIWRLHLTMSTVISTIGSQDALTRFSEGRIHSIPPSELLARLVDFTAAGFESPSSFSTIEETPEKKGPSRALTSAALAIGLFATACTPGDLLTDLDSEPDVPLISHFSESTAQQSDIALVDRDWVTGFGSPALERFVGEVMSRNRDLKAANARINQALAGAWINRADGLPELAASFNGQRNKQNFIGLPIPGSTGILSSYANQFSPTLQASWEVDVWGRIAAAKRASLAEWQASVENAKAAELSIAGQAVKLWLQGAELQSQVDLTRQTLATFRRTESLIRDRFESGLTNLDSGAGVGQSLSSQLILAEADTASAKAALASQQEQLARVRRQLQVLAGEYPDGDRPLPSDLPGLPGFVPTGLPADLLDRRPDLLAAERRLEAADSRVTEAKRSFFPTLTLTGQYGTSSEDISDILDSDLSIWGIAGNAVQPLIQHGRLRGNLFRTQAQRDEVIANYEQAALTAFAEVENALAAERWLRQQEEALQSAADRNRAAYRQSVDEFTGGNGDLLTVLTSQQRVFQSRSSWRTARRLLLQNRVDLHIALGGSFLPKQDPKRN